MSRRRARAQSRQTPCAPPSEDVLETRLSGACTLEVASFDRFVSLLAGEESAERYDHVVFDRAPTGHTLRLLQLPAAWDRFLADNTYPVTRTTTYSDLRAKLKAFCDEVAESGEPLTVEKLRQRLSLDG